MVNTLAETAQDIARVTQGHSRTQYRIVIDSRNAHPFAVKHRLTFFAHKANRHLEVESQGKHTTVLRVHTGR